MSRILFLNMPAHGHINPTLAIVKELVTMGHEVDYCGLKNYRKLIEEAGAHFIEYTSPGISGPKSGEDAITHLPKKLIGDGLAAIPQVKEKIMARKLDLIVYDNMCIWGRTFAQGSKIPSAIIRPTYATNSQFSLMPPQIAQQFLDKWDSEEILAGMKKLAELCFDTTPIDIKTMWTHAEALNLVTIPSAIQPKAETFDARYVFTGMCHYPRDRDVAFDTSPFQNKTTLFFSLGTVFNEWPEFFSMCIDAFKNDPQIQIVLAAGDRVAVENLGVIPKNVTVAPHVPQLKIFPHTAVCVFHGGMNTTLEALAHNIPLIVIPQMGEQAMTARRVEELGLGKKLEKSAVTANLLRETVMTVLEDRRIHGNVKSWSEMLKNQNGGKVAALAIANFLGRC